METIFIFTKILLLTLTTTQNGEEKSIEYCQLKQQHLHENARRYSCLQSLHFIRAKPLPSSRRAEPFFAGLLLRQAARRIISRRDLRDINIDALRNAPMDFSFCGAKADAMLTDKGKFLIPDLNLLTAKCMPMCKNRQFPPVFIINYFNGYFNKFCWHGFYRRRTPCFFSTSSASFTSWTEMHSASAIS